MKKIQPVSIWYNGLMVSATIFNLVSISDNLSTTASFDFQLFVDPKQQVAQGNITMTGADYITYSTSPDSNTFAYNWAAGKLNLTLV